jgi:hypothetical protein
MIDPDFTDRSARRQKLDTFAVPPDRTRLDLIRRGLVELGIATYMLFERGRWIHCNVCGANSPHPRDIIEVYCPRCDRFHLDVLADLDTPQE